MCLKNVTLNFKCMQLKELLAEKHQEGLLFNKIVIIYVMPFFNLFRYCVLSFIF